MRFHLEIEFRRWKCTRLRADTDWDRGVSRRNVVILQKEFTVLVLEFCSKRSSGVSDIRGMPQWIRQRFGNSFLVSNLRLERLCL